MHLCCFCLLPCQSLQNSSEALCETPIDCHYVVTNRLKCSYSRTMASICPLPPQRVQCVDIPVCAVSLVTLEPLYWWLILNRFLSPTWSPEFPRLEPPAVNSNCHLCSPSSLRLESKTRMIGVSSTVADRIQRGFL